MQFPTKRLSEMIIFSNGKSIKPGGEGEFPVYGANGIIGYCDQPREKNGVIIGRVGAYCGSVAYCPGRFWASDNTIMAYPKTDDHDIRFLYYLLKDSNLNRWAGGAAQPLLTQTVLNQIEAASPFTSTQQKIGAILSAYDDLIENNLRRIKILEEMAQTLYQEWFVKFRFPGHQKVKMVNSPMGKIPEGWGVKPLESLISEHIGGGWGKENSDGAHTEPAFVVRGTNIPDARRCNISNVPYRYHTLSNLRSRQLKAGDIIFEVSGGSKGQPLGRTLYISSELLSAFGGKRVICASFCKRIKPNARLYFSEILYLSFLEAYDSGEIEQFQVQSTGISNFKWTEYIQQTHRGIPPNTLQARFGELVKPLFSQIATLGLKNRNLRQTRDLLLPKLISGELDVSELDISIPEANA